MISGTMDVSASFEVKGVHALIVVAVHEIASRLHQEVDGHRHIPSGRSHIKPREYVMAVLATSVSSAAKVMSCEPS